MINPPQKIVERPISYWLPYNSGFHRPAVFEQFNAKSVFGTPQNLAPNFNIFIFQIRYGNGNNFPDCKACLSDYEQTGTAIIFKPAH